MNDVPAKRRPASKWPAALLGMILGGTAGLAIENEGLVLRSYADPAWGWAVPTACMGDTGPHIQRGMTFTESQCFDMLDARLQRTWDALIARCIHAGAELSIHEALALLSWTDNVGVGAACGSTLMRQLNAGEPGEVWCPQMYRWVYANKKVLAGLQNRREREVRVCLGQRDLLAEKGVELP